MERYFVVNFTEDSSVAVVPSTWVEDELCAWPPIGVAPRLPKMIKQCDPPNQNWRRLKVIVMYKTDSYERAREKERLAEDISDIQSSSDKEKEQRSNKRALSSSDDEEYHVPSNLHHNAEGSNRLHNFDNIINRPSTSKARHPRLDDIHSTFQHNSIPSQHKTNLIPLTPSNTTQHTRTNFMSTPLRHNITSTSQELRPKDLDRRNELFQRKVLKLLENLTEEMKDMKQKLAENVSLKHQPSKLPPGCPTLPVENIEDLVELDIFLKNDDDSFQVRTFFCCLGGLSVKDCARRVLAKLISNPLSTKYNWKGSRGEKLPFSSLTCVVQLISDTVRAHKQFETATDVEIQDAIKKWLMHSKDREGGRSSRIVENNYFQEM